HGAVAGVLVAVHPHEGALERRPHLLPVQRGEALPAHVRAHPRVVQQGPRGVVGGDQPGGTGGELHFHQRCLPLQVEQTGGRVVGTGAVGHRVCGQLLGHCDLFSCWAAHSSTSLVRAEVGTARRGGTLNRERAPLIGAPRVGAVSQRTSLEVAVTMYDHVGGEGPLRRLAEVFHRKAVADPMIGRLFDYAGETHVRNLTAYLVEVFGHGSAFTDQIGGFEHV